MSFACCRQSPTKGSRPPWPACGRTSTTVTWRAPVRTGWSSASGLRARCLTTTSRSTPSSSWRTERCIRSGGSAKEPLDPSGRSAFERGFQLLRIAHDPGFGHLARVVDVKEEDLLVLEGLSVPRDGGSHQRRDVTVAREDVVDVLLDVLEGLRVLHDVGHRRLLAFEIRAELGRPAPVPDGVLGEGVANGLQVTTLERVKGLSHAFDLLLSTQLGSRFCHVRPPSSRCGSTPTLPGRHPAAAYGPTIDRLPTLSSDAHHQPPDDRRQAATAGG